MARKPAAGRAGASGMTTLELARKGGKSRPRSRRLRLRGRRGVRGLLREYGGRMKGLGGSMVDFDRSVRVGSPWLPLTRSV
jgi:hypothetical protein